MGNRETALKNLPEGGGPGRPLGSKNKIHGMTKDAFMAVFKDLDASELLHDWALNNPALFKDIWKQLLPKAIEVTGEDGGPIEGRWTVEVVKPKEDKDGD